ncbi:MAG: ABC transporter substrate-binding protein [Cryomorphaceae bacterium]|nr:ABC transporter substrate-binding protein [Cryomorphaceae bacterium]
MLNFRLHLISAIIILTSLISGCSPSATTDEHSHQRIITLGGAVSEIVAALGAENHIVATDITSVYPPTLREKPNLGHQSQVKIESILAQKPDVIISLKDFLSDENKEMLTRYQIELIEVENHFSLSSTKKMISTIGRTLNLADKATALIDNLPALSESTPQANKPRVLFVYARGAGALNIAGRETFAASIIALAGGENAVDAFTDFRALTPEALAAANPDYLLFFTSGYESMGGTEGILKIPGVKETRAGKNKAFIYMDSSLLSNFGPRLGEAVDELRTKITAEL